VENPLPELPTVELPFIEPPTVELPSDTGDQGGSPPPTEALPPQPELPATETPAPTAEVAQSPLRGGGRGALPPDVAEQLARNVGAGGLFAPTDVPPTVELPAQFEIAKGSLVVFPGFDQVTPIDLTVTLPDGQVRSFQVLPEHPFAGTVGNALALRFIPQVGDPLGTYLFYALQGDRQASAAAPVVLATSPWITTPGDLFQPPFGPQQALPPGGVFNFALSGVAPEQLVELYLYRGTEGHEFPLDFSYLATLPPVTVDVRGEALFTLPTQPDDPPGFYLIETRPKSNFVSDTTAPPDRYFGDGVFEVLPPD
jgi:hypothetical protein